MILYLGIIAFIFAASMVGLFVKKKKIVTIIALSLSAIVAIIFCSLKSDSIGPDTIEYHKMLETISQKSFVECLNSKTEFGFSIFMKIISYISKSFTFFNFIFYSIVWGSFFVFSLKVSKEPAFCFSLIFTFALQFALTAYRQTLAVSMIVLAIALFTSFKNRIFGIAFFFIFFFIGLSFHISTIICLFIPLIYFLCSKHQINLPICLGIFIAFLFGSRPLYYLIADSTGTPYSPFIRNSIPFTSLMAFLIFLLSYYLNHSKRMEMVNNGIETNQSNHSGFKLRFESIERRLSANEEFKNDVYLKTSTLLALVAACTMSFSLITTVITRIYVFFEATLAFTVVETIANRNDKKVKIVAYVLLGIASIAYFYISLRRSGYLEYYVPYETCF